MGKNRFLGQFCKSLCFILLVHVRICDSQEPAPTTFTVSSFKYPTTVLKPYNWRYIRVELPPFFSSMTFVLESNVDVDLNDIKNASGTSLPMICFREGSPPLPDVHDNFPTGLEHISNASFVGKQSLQNVEMCYPMQKHIWLRVTNEQISPGTWYFGLFNGIGPLRTQSKMINRGALYSFSGNISVEGCMTSMTSGQFCNQTVNMLSCNDSYDANGNRKNILTCGNANGIICQENNALETYLLDIRGIVEELIITAANVTFSTSQNGIGSRSLMCYARYGGMPLNTVYDFSGYIDNTPLVIPFPKIGSWYISVQPVDISNNSAPVQINILRACYILELQIFQCPVGKAGVNCSLEKYTLQAVLRKNPSVPFESSYLPITEKVSTDSRRFLVEPLSSNFSNGRNNSDTWTFFLLNVPSGAAGANIHIFLTSNTKIDYEIYVRSGGLPSLSSWDYFYANSTTNSNGSMFYKLYDSSDYRISFYIIYAKVGTWSFGLRQLKPANVTSQTSISFSLERCPKKCSAHGTCQSMLDTSGLALYSFCACDRNHGGFDCSAELVSDQVKGQLLNTHVGHIRQSIFLIASNAAAVLPAYWSLRNKAFAEWVLFTSSGISSGLYHACDVGTWCVMSFRILQFLDFWLSFMAVVSTFVFLTTISEGSKRTIHTVVAILTAVMAETGPTRSSNIAYVISIGAMGLLIGWLLEFCRRYRSYSFPREFHLNLLDRWKIIKGWIQNIIKTIVKHFRWGFILAGFAALAMAAVSWKMESTESYWIWHSQWHVFIYTSSFLFLCSKAKVPSLVNERPSDRIYEQTRQNPSHGDQQRN